MSPSERQTRQTHLITGIDHLQIAAPKGCEAEARRFFGGLLGLEEIDKPEGLRTRGGCWFRLASGQLHIGVEEDFRPARKAHPAFAVQNVEALYDTLVAAGITCIRDEAVPGVRRFYADDPWGNRLEFTESTSTEDENHKAIETHLRSLEESLLRPAVRHDPRTLLGLLADDFCEFGSSGRIFNRQQIIEVLRAEPTEPSDQFSVHDFRVRMLGGDSAMVTYRAIRHDASSQQVSESLRSSLWIKHNRSWKMLFHQGTRR